MNDLILFHANCRDGQVAAWVYRTHLLATTRKEPRMVPAHYQTSLDPVSFRQHDRVGIVDFCPAKNDLIRICAVSREVVLLDHHKTAAAMFDGWPMAERPRNLIVVFDMTRSGAGIAWDYCNLDRKRPALVDYVEDRDLWRWKMPHAKEVAAWLETVPVAGTKPLDDVHWRLEDPDALQEVVGQGSAILRATENRVQRNARNAFKINLGQHQAAAVNTCSDISETCDRILKDNPDVEVAITYFDNLRDGKRIFSLRSRPGQVDVAAIALERGGGGICYGRRILSPDTRVVDMMRPFIARFANKEQGVGKVGYFLVKGDADGSWRVTDKNYGDHEIVGACDTPDALMPRVMDYLNRWISEQESIFEGNVLAIQRAPEVKPGFRKGWKASALAHDRRQLARAKKSHDRVVQVVASILAHNGWPVGPFEGEILSPDAAVSG